MCLWAFFRCWTWESTPNFEPNLLFNPRGLIVLIPLNITGYMCLDMVSIPSYLPVVGIEPANEFQ